MLISNVEDRMAKTNMDFYSTSSTFCQRGGTAGVPRREVVSKEASSRANYRPKRFMDAPSMSNRQSNAFHTLSPGKMSHQLSPRKPLESDHNYLEKEEMKLEKWYNINCGSKWDYRPKKLDSE